MRETAKEVIYPADVNASSPLVPILLLFPLLLVHSLEVISGLIVNRYALQATFLPQGRRYREANWELRPHLLYYYILAQWFLDLSRPEGLLGCPWAVDPRKLSNKVIIYRNELITIPY